MDPDFVIAFARVRYKGQTGTITAYFPDGIAWIQLDSATLIAAPLQELQPIEPSR